MGLPKKIAYALPSFFTFLSMCCGLTAIKLAASENFKVVLFLIGSSAIMDSIDGSLARKLGVQSFFGAQLDSFADLISFGIAPSITLYYWSLYQLGSLGWLATLFFCISITFRLARYNCSKGNLGPETVKNEKAKSLFFFGIPSPAAAILLIVTIIAQIEGVADMQKSPILLLCWIIFIGFYAASSLPNFSIKVMFAGFGRKVSIAIALFLITSFALSPLKIMLAGTAIWIMFLPLSIYSNSSQMSAEGISKIGVAITSVCVVVFSYIIIAC